MHKCEATAIAMSGNVKMTNDNLTFAEEMVIVRSSENLDQLDDCTISTVKRSNVTQTQTMSSIGITPSFTTDSTNEHSVRAVNVQEQNSLASDLTTSTAFANSNQTTTTAASTSYMSFNVEQFPSLEVFYSALQNATAGNSGLQLSAFVQGSVTSAARSLLPEYIAGNGFIASDRMTVVVQDIQGNVEEFQRRNIEDNESTNTGIHVINGPLIEWAIKSTVVNLQFPSLEAFYSALQNATAGNSGLQLSAFVQGSVTSAACLLLPEYIAGNGFIASDRMTVVVQDIQGNVEEFQRRNIDENTIHIINGPLIEWAIKSTIENL